MPRKPAPLKVWIDGVEVLCPVIERLGFCHDIGARMAVVMHGGRDRTATNKGGRWHLWGASDRIQPLVDHIKQCAREGRVPFSR